jgi:hypothetical protein
VRRLANLHALLFLYARSIINVIYRSEPSPGLQGRYVKLLGYLYGAGSSFDNKSKINSGTRARSIYIVLKATRHRGAFALTVQKYFAVLSQLTLVLTCGH